MALQPNLDTDGELWSSPFPRRLRLRGGPGRAILLSDGEIQVIQVARGGDWVERPNFAEPAFSHEEWLLR